MAKERLKIKSEIGAEVNNVLKLLSQEKNFLLSGGAGSGKTHSLVSILLEIFQRTSMVNIACITYTRAAAKEIAERINHPNLRVSTIHDFLWDIISPFQHELKEIVINEIREDNEGYIDEGYFDKIQYKEYKRIKEGIITHDDVIDISYLMFKNHPKLSRIVGSSFKYIFVDEYQDTSPKVISILLEHLQQSTRRPIVGFFGDSMQSIYDKGVGDINDYIDSSLVHKIEKKQNYRNPLSVIRLGNKIRTDGLIQEPSKDNDAPNMLNGKVKEGNTTFLYSQQDELEFDIIRNSKYCNKWNFEDSNETKELRLTHRLIADENNYKTLFDIYSNDTFVKLISKLKKRTDMTHNEKLFKEVIAEIGLTQGRGNNKRDYLEVILEEPSNHELYNYLENLTWNETKSIYFKIENLIDGKLEAVGDEREVLTERDVLIKHLFKIQNLIDSYENNNYLDFINKVDYSIKKIGDKERLNTDMIKLSNGNFTIKEAIEFADKRGLCRKDDAIVKFIDKNHYLYFRASEVKFSEFQSLYKYLEGYLPFSTQHKIKGLEFDNVLILLDNGKWNNYNFNYLFKDEGTVTVLERTKKLFYVCITRTKENLVVYFPNPDADILMAAEKIFGFNNVKSVDKEVLAY